MTEDTNITNDEKQAGRRGLAAELREYVEKEIVARNPKRIDPYNCPEDLRGALTTLNGILYKLSELEELR